MSSPIHTIVTHVRPHLDELAAIWALRQFGEKKYPGADKAKIVWFDPAEHLDDRSEAQWLGEGYLFLGVRGGEFDDHPHERFPDDCVFTLVLEALGKHEDPSLDELAHHVLSEDRNGAPHALHVAQVIKHLHRSASFDQVLSFAEIALTALWERQKSFLEVLDVVRRPEHLQVVLNEITGREFVLCVVESDNEDVSVAARDKRNGPDAALVVQKNSRGHIYISSSHRQGVCDITPLVIELRGAEQELQHFGPQVEDVEQLGGDGMFLGWYHQRQAAAAFCGSLTSPHQPASEIGLGEIRNMAVWFLETFEPVEPKPRNGARSREFQGN